MSDRPAYLLLLAPGTERRMFADYVAAVSPQLKNHGGRQLALAPASAVEIFGHNDGPVSVMLSRWPSSAHLHEFWNCAGHRRLVGQRHRISTLVAVALEGVGASTTAAAGDDVLAIFLGNGPSPAFLEAEGGHPLALARSAEVEPLQGVWSHGDIAIYGWAEAQGARQQMLMFSSGQRARGLLVPALRAPPHLAVAPMVAA